MIRIKHNIPSLRRALRRAPAKVMRELDAGVRRGAKEVMRDARDLAPKATSLLTQSIRTQRIGMAEQAVIADAQHALATEIGRKPGLMPPVQSLIDWIRTVKIEPNAEGVRNERDLAFVIGRKIARDGIEAQPYMAPALRKNESRLNQIMRESAIRGVQRAFA